MRISLILIFVFYAFTSLASTPISINSLWQNDKQITEVLLPKEKTKVAIFERNGYAYIVLEKNNFQITPPKSWAIIPHPFSLILRTPLNNRKINIEKTDTNLRILLEEKQRNVLPSIFILGIDTNGVLIKIPNAPIISFFDPNTQENITALPVNYSQLFISDEYQTPEITFIPSTLGVVIVDKTGNMKLSATQNGYLWKPIHKDSITPLQNKNNFFTYQKMPLEKWQEQIQLIKTFIPRSDTKLKEYLHTELALLYLSKGFTQKALEIADMDKNETLFTIINYISQKEMSFNNPYSQQKFYFNRATEIEKKDKQQAKSFYQKAYDIKPTSIYGTQSLIALIYVALDEKTLDRKTAITTLEKISILLADKTHRIKLSKTLATLYEEEGFVLNALDKKRELLSLTKDENLTQKMRYEFENLFNKKTLKTPQERILAYYRFQELMPTGETGFDIKNQLINDYIDLDLLPQAYNLAIQTAQEQTGISSQRTYIKAGLIAQLMQDKEQTQKAFELSNLKNIKDFSFITQFHPLLQSEWLKVKP